MERHPKVNEFQSFCQPQNWQS